MQKEKKVVEETKIVIQLALYERKLHSKMSCKKVYLKIKDKIKAKGIKMGRDKFIEIMGKNGLHVKKRRKYKQTTNSNHNNRTYPNMIKNMEIKLADEVWASDITYLETSEGTLYLSLITDLCTRRIMGYASGDDLSTTYCSQALEMAKKNSRKGKAKIHHSDRGVQYSSEAYKSHLGKETAISMTRGGSPHENAIAERINGILKQEYGISDKHHSKSQCRKLVDEAIFLYNTDRPHISLGMKTPEEFYTSFYAGVQNNVENK